MSLKDFTNTVNTVSFSSLVNQGLWACGSIVFTALTWWLAVHDKPFMELALLMVSGWLGKSGVTALSRYGKSKTAVPYVEAKARGEAVATAEHKALPPLHVDHADKVTVVPEPLHRRSSELPTPSAASMELDTVEHEWARGDPREGIL